MSGASIGARCPSCGAARVEAAGPGTLRCLQCGTYLDAQLRPLPPMHAPGAPHTLPEDAEQTWIQLDPSEEIPTDPRAGGAPPLFAAPPPVAPAGFAAPPPKDAFERRAQDRPWSRAVGDGGPPPGLDLLVLVLAGLDILSIGLWSRSNAPLAGMYMVPLVASLLIVYFFWQGKNWARFLMMTGALIELVALGLAFAVVRRHMTLVEMGSIFVRLGLDAYFLWFCVRPDTVAFFERRSGRVGAKR